MFADHVRRHGPRRDGRASTATSRTAPSPRSAGCAATLAALGSAAIEGPVISWVADHRKHHAFSDQEGDPHSPHVDHGGGWAGALRGLAHAHVGWLFIHTHRGAKDRYAPDLVARPGGAVRRPHVRGLGARRAWRRHSGSAMRSAARWTRRSPGCCGAAGCGCSFSTTSRTASTRCATSSGSRRFPTGDESRNLAWLAPLTFGEAWHNNHHAFPTSAAHGLRRWEVDLSAALIRALERLGLAWDVVRGSRPSGRPQSSRATPRDDARRRDGAAAHGAGRGAPGAPVHRRASGTAPRCRPPNGARPHVQARVAARARAHAAGARPARRRPRIRDRRRRGRRHRRRAGAARSLAGRLRSTRAGGCGWRPPRSGPERCARCRARRRRSCAPAAAATATRATGARCATTTTCRTSSSPCSSTSP